MEAGGNWSAVHSMPYPPSHRIIDPWEIGCQGTSGCHLLPELPRGMGNWHLALQHATGAWDLLFPRNNEFLDEMSHAECSQGDGEETERKAFLAH